MIIYTTARLIAALQGYAWPLEVTKNGDDINAILAYYSALSFPIEVFLLYMIVAKWWGARKKHDN